MSCLHGLTIVLALAMLLRPGGAAAISAPVKAKTVKAELVTFYPACTAPDTTTNPPFAIAACANASPEDPVCGFGSKGSGKFAMAVVRTDMNVGLTVVGLLPACDGSTMTLTVDARMTTTDCTASGTCTVVDIDDFPTGTCVVAAGRCAIKTTVETFLGIGTNLFKDGQIVNLSGAEVRLKRGVATTLISGVKIGPF